jgi:C_GCAxxG_C_C family probable redox protein
MLKAMDTFGGGLGAHGETCGALIGGLAVIGLIFGRSAGDKHADFRMWKYAHEFMKRFRGEIANGNILCRDIVGVNWMDQNQVKEYREGQKHAHCRKLTGGTAKLVGEIIERATAV